MGNHEEAQSKKKPHTWVEKTQVLFFCCCLLRQALFAAGHRGLGVSLTFVRCDTRPLWLPT